MSFSSDTDIIEDIVLRRDAAFAVVDQRRITPKLDVLRTLEDRADIDAYVLAAMELMALPGNGHTRLIPNAAINILPVRIVAIGSSFVVTNGAMEAAANRNTKLIAVNGVPVEEMFNRARTHLAGVPARQKAVGAILFAWPAALRAFGAGSQTGRVTYSVNTPGCGYAEFALDEKDCVRAGLYYPDREHGVPQHPKQKDAWAICTKSGTAAIHVRLPDFHCPDSDALESDLSRAADTILDEPDIGLVFDLRGNRGGDFLRTIGLIDTLAARWRGERYAILVDKFTFSAAIVFVAILKRRLRGSGQLIGEPMGDGTRFYAEGGTRELPQSGAAVRYSTAYHDWHDGRAAPSTPSDIVPHLVAAGGLMPDRSVEITVSDLQSGSDPPLAAALEYLRG
ncbi:MAG: peptidase S41 [Alphaproteobacteria bacterium]|nr:peptidase S41 [Alphaproteobacteria bacterium]